MIPYKIIGVIAVIGITAYFSYQAGGDSVRADAADAVQDAVKKARKEEQAKQEKVNELAQAQYNELSDINSDLNANLIRLRNRPSRRNVSDSTETACKGANGADLSAQDAEFLTRESARGDRLRTALKACYEYADTVSN